MCGGGGGGVWFWGNPGGIPHKLNIIFLSKIFMFSISILFRKSEKKNPCLWPLRREQLWLVTYGQVSRGYDYVYQLMPFTCKSAKCNTHKIHVVTEYREAQPEAGEESTQNAHPTTSQSVHQEPSHRAYKRKWLIVTDWIGTIFGYTRLSYDTIYLFISC